MLKFRKIPLIRAAVCEAIVFAARQHGTPVQKLADAADFPIHALEHPEMLVPQLPARQLIESISRLEGDQLFGVRMAQALPFQKIRTVIPTLQGCSNLYNLLKRFCMTVHLQCDHCCYVLKEEGDLIWMAQTYPHLHIATDQAELFQLAGMIRLVQSVVGEDWRPPQIHLRTERNIQTENAQELNPSQIHFLQPWVVIAVPRNLLALTVPSTGITLENNDSKIVSEIPTKIGESLVTAMSPYLGSKKLNRELASDITGMSFRTLQRRLAQADTSYLKIVAQVRFQKAETLLKGSDESLLNVCMQLGYENAPSFTRAFRRWSGMTPKEYRKNHGSSSLPAN